MKKIPILNFPRLLNLEKRISGPTELSVEEIKNLEKRLISSIQEISSSLEKEETKYPKKFKEKENFNELEEKDLIINDENSLVYNKQINVENINTNHNCNNTVNDVKNEVITVEKLELNQKLIENPENENCEKLPETLERNPELPISKPNELYTKSPYKISEQTLEIKPLLEIKEKKTNTIEIKRSSKQSVPKRKLEDSSKQAFLDEYFTEKPTQNNENSQGLSIKAKVNKFKEVNINLKSPISPIQTPTITFSGVKVKELEDYEKELKILREKLNEKERESKEKERLLERLTEEKAKYKEKHDSFIEDFESYKYQVQKLLSNYLLECERYKKNEIKTHLSSQRHRLGEYINQRNGSKFEDIWVDGYELRNLKEMLNKISNDKEELKEKKKKLKKGVDDSNEKEIISQRIKILSNV